MQHLSLLNRLELKVKSDNPFKEIETYELNQLEINIEKIRIKKEQSENFFGPPFAFLLMVMASLITATLFITIGEFLVWIFKK